MQQVTIPTELIVGQEQNIFGSKVYETFDELKESNELAMSKTDNVLAAIDNVADNLKSAIEQNIIKPALEEYELTQTQTKRLVKESQIGLETKIEKIKGDWVHRSGKPA